MTIEKRQLSEQNDNFIMLPTVDFCFKELMQNKEVRKGILSALLGRNPEELEDTELLPTILQPEYQDRETWNSGCKSSICRRDTDGSRDAGSTV